MTDAYDLPDGASNVLVLGRPHGREPREACIDLLTVVPGARTDVLFVTFTEPAQARLDAWRDRVDDAPAKVGVVSVDDGGRSAAASTPEGVSVRTVSEPGDLTGVGIAVTEHLSEWHGDGNRVVVCFRSVTALLQYADLELAFKFLNELTSRLARAEAVAHFHVDPSAHDERALNTLKPLFDAVIDRTPEAADAAGDAPAGAPSDRESPADGPPADTSGDGPVESEPVDPESTDVSADESDADAGSAAGGEAESEGDDAGEAEDGPPLPVPVTTAVEPAGEPSDAGPLARVRDRYDAVETRRMAAAAVAVALLATVAVGALPVFDGTAMIDVGGDGGTDGAAPAAGAAGTGTGTGTTTPTVLPTVTPTDAGASTGTTAATPTPTATSAPGQGTATDATGGDGGAGGTGAPATATPTADATDAPPSATDTPTPTPTPEILETPTADPLDTPTSTELL